jgi:hypothetical protein
LINLLQTVQLVLFSAVALLALVGGLGAIFRRVWAAYILLALSWVGALYFFIWLDSLKKSGL